MAGHIKIDGKVYNEVGVDEISLRQLLLFDAQVAEMGLSYRWSDAERLFKEFDGLDEAEAAVHPEGLFYTAAVVWVTRQANGDDVTFEEAVDISPSSIDFIPGPEDHKKSGPTKGAKSPKKKSTRPSAPVAQPVEDEGQTSTSETSESPSTVE